MGTVLVLLALTAGFAGGALLQRSSEELNEPQASTATLPPTTTPSAPTEMPPAPTTPPTPELPAIALPDTPLPAVPFRCSGGQGDMVRLGEDGMWTDPSGRGTLSLTAATTASLPGDVLPSTIAAVAEQCAGSQRPLVTLVLVDPTGVATFSEPATTADLVRVDRLDVDASGIFTASGLVALDGTTPGAVTEGSVQFRCGPDGFERLTR